MDCPGIRLVQLSLLVKERRHCLGILSDRTPQLVIAQICALHMRRQHILLAQGADDFARLGLKIA
jgi:hypothetical protein